MDTFERLRTAAELTENDRAIITYVLDHPEEIAALSTRELARRTHTSPSAVSRCCQRLGFSSYTVFKAKVASDLKATDPGTVSIATNERAISALAKSASLYEKVAGDMRQALSTDALTRVASMVEDASYTSILGLESNALCAGYARINLLLAGQVAQVLSDTESISRFSLVAPSETVALLISRGGHSRSLVVAAQNLRRLHVPTVAITTDATSPLASACDETLVGYSSIQGNLIYAAWSISVGLIVDTLTSMLYSRQLAQNRGANQAHYDQYLNELDNDEAVRVGTGHFVGDVDEGWFRTKGV